MTPPWKRGTPDYPDRVDGPLAITDVTVVPMDAEHVLPGRTVVVRDGTIDRVAQAGQVDTTGMTIVDGTGRYLMPGLTDMHAHLGDSTDQITARDAGELLIYLNAGVTTVRNMWSDPFHLALRSQVADGRLPGPRIVVASPIVEGLYGDTGKPPVSMPIALGDPAAAAGVVRALKDRGYDLVKPYSNLTADVLTALGRACAEVGLPLAGHCPDAVTYAEAADAGMTSIEHFGGILNGLMLTDRAVGHFFDVDPDTVSDVIAEFDWAALERLADRFAAEQIWNCPTLGLRERIPAVTAVDQPMLRARTEALALISPLTATILSTHPIMNAPPTDEPDRVQQGRELRNQFFRRILTTFHDRGAPLLVGSDAPLARIGEGVHDELAVFVDAGLSPYEALRCATTEPARYLGQDDLWGTVTEGKRADLLVVEGNPLTDVANARKISSVITNGYHLSASVLGELLRVRAEKLAVPLSPPVWDGPSRTLQRQVMGTTVGLLSHSRQQLGQEPLLPSDTMSVTILGLLPPGTTQARALHADHEAVEIHTLTVQTDDRTRTVLADHPREPVNRHTVDLDSDGEIVAAQETSGPVKNVHLVS